MCLQQEVGFNVRILQIMFWNANRNQMHQRFIENIFIMSHRQSGEFFGIGEHCDEVEDL